MNTQNVQHMLVDTIRGLFRDPQSAATYAQNPNGYLADKMEGYDLTGVDVPAAVNAAVQQSNMPTEMADAVNGAVYQPAPMIRVPAPREGYNDPNYVEKKFELDKDRPNLTDVNDPGVRVEADRPVFDPSDRPPIDTEVKPPEGRPVEEDKPAENYDKPADDYDKPVEDYDRPVEDYDRPVEDYDNPVDYDYPPVLEETPPGYEQMDGGGYRYEPPADYSPDAYHPDNYGPTTEININHIEYSVSNTVITVHYDRPEIADKLAETRPYEDPYDRVDPAHDYSDAVIVQHPDYEYPPTEHYEDKPWYEDKPVDEYDDKYEEKYDDKPVDEYDDKYEEKYDDKPVDEHDDKYEEKYEDKPVDDYRDDPDRMDRDPHYEDKPQHDNQYGNDNGHNQQEQYDNGHQQEQYGNGHDNGHQQEQYGNGHAEPEYQAPAEAHNDYGNGGGHANDEPDTYVEPEVHHEPAAETYVEPEPYVEPEVHHEPAAETYVEPEVHHEPEPMADEMVGE